MIFHSFLLTSALMTMSTAVTAAATTASVRGSRSLQVTKTEWPECVSKNMSTKQCAQMVRLDARNHEIDNLVVKVVVPRTKEEIQTTYMKVGITVNIYNEVTGDKNDGMINYPFVWVSSLPDNTRELGPWDCSGGMLAWDCCEKIRRDVPDMDIHGNHIQCFAHLQEFVPEVDPDDPGVYHQENLRYNTFVYDPTTESYEKRIFTPEEILEIQIRRNATLNGELTVIDDTLSNDNMTAAEILALEKELMEATSGMGDAQNMLGDMENLLEDELMGADIGALLDPAMADDPLLSTPIDTTEGSQMGDILRAVRHKIYDYTSTNFVLEKYIWIYASHNDKVKRTPQIGGVFDGHEEALKDIPGYEDFKLRYVSNLTNTEPTGGARYLKWKEVEV